MQLGLAIAVALLIVGAVAWPVLAGRWRTSSRTPDQQQADEVTITGNAALEDVYEAIRTLQMEHSLGRIDDGDFREQLDQYRLQAAAILRDMDRQGEAPNG